MTGPRNHWAGGKEVFSSFICLLELPLQNITCWVALTAEFTFSQFQRLEVHSQGRQGILLLGSLSLTCWWPVRPHRALCLCTCIPGISSSSYKHPSHLESELPLASFYLHYFFKGPFILQSYSQVLGIRTSIYLFGGWHSIHNILLGMVRPLACLRAGEGVFLA